MTAWRELRTDDGASFDQRDHGRRRRALARSSPGARRPRWSSRSPSRCPSRSPTATSARCTTWASRPARRCRRSGSTACSSAPARTRRIGDLRAAAALVEGRKVAGDVARDGRARLPAGGRPGRGRGARRGLPRRRLRLAHGRLLDVPGHEPRHPPARRALRLDLEPQLRGPPGPRRPHAPRLARRWPPRRRSRGTSSTSGSGSDGARQGRLRQGVRARPRGRRHRPDHPQAVPQAGRAHRLRRVPLLRLEARGRLGPAAQPDPRHRPELRLRLEPRARARGRSRTTASRPSSPPRSPTSSSTTARRSGCCRSCCPRTRSRR